MYYGGHAACDVKHALYEMSALPPCACPRPLTRRPSDIEQGLQAQLRRGKEGGPPHSLTEERRCAGSSREIDCGCSARGVDRSSHRQGVSPHRWRAGQPWAPRDTGDRPERRSPHNLPRGAAAPKRG
ncbi:hypothetical protein NDU88_003937 [Pleurodeles waltl]|uniref:Uncharacterized protein n=1 Tax=Pleurodeles waltl TaxID=8319 RepID=A0AAV7QEP5_PLEWA|nr:hypothetical protein NDU88_003937 [Pleurodeles waltl]